jgi:hypothetical protein
MAEIRQFMFRLSYQYARSSSVYASLRGHAFESQDLYQITWWHWGASLGVTLLIVLCVTPTFWGFWALSRVPTMSPLETARAFDTTVLANPNSEAGMHEMQRVERCHS